MSSGDMPKQAFSPDAQPYATLSVAAAMFSSALVVTEVIARAADNPLHRTAMTGRP